MTSVHRNCAGRRGRRAMAGLPLVCSRSPTRWKGWTVRARLAGMDRQTLRDWVHRYNEEGIAGLSNRVAPGRSPKLTEGQMAALKAVVLTGPDPVVDGVVRWRIVDLCRWVEERWSVSYSETGMLRLLWSLDLSHRKTRPRHPQTDEKAQQAFKKGALQPA